MCRHQPVLLASCRKRLGESTCVTGLRRAGNMTSRVHSTAARLVVLDTYVASNQVRGYGQRRQRGFESLVRRTTNEKLTHDQPSGTRRNAAIAPS